MANINLSSISDADHSVCDRIAKRAKVNLRDCYQCGKCSAGCPMSTEMDLPPQKVMRMLQLGMADRVLNARSPWLCAQCMTCTARCPQEIDIAAIMRETRIESHRTGHRVVKESDAFETLFIKNVHSHGRSNEQYLAASYNLHSGHLMQDMDSAPLMFTKGLIGIATNNVGDRDAVRRLIDRCAESDAVQESQEGGC